MTHHRMACYFDHMQGAELIAGTLTALEPIIQGINAAAQNTRYQLVSLPCQESSAAIHSKSFCLMLSGTAVWCTMVVSTSGMFLGPFSGRACMLSCWHHSSKSWRLSGSCPTSKSGCPVCFCKWLLLNLRLCCSFLILDLCIRCTLQPIDGLKACVMSDILLNLNKPHDTAVPAVMQTERHADKM